MEKVSEISFINTLEAQNRKIEVLERYQVYNHINPGKTLFVNLPRDEKLDCRNYWMSAKRGEMNS